MKQGKLTGIDISQHIESHSMNKVHHIKQSVTNISFNLEKVGTIIQKTEEYAETWVVHCGCDHWTLKH
jgi:hypothetical protein